MNSDIIVRPAEAGARLRVLPLGGVGEFGKNMMLIEYGNDALIIDMGFAFPGPEQPGVDYLIPDPKYLMRNKSKIRGAIITHGHMDHIGAAPYVLSRLKVPVYGTRLSLAMVAKQVAEFGLKPDLRELDPERHQRVQLGCLEVELVRVNHAIADAAAVVVRTPVGTIINTGDWRLDPDPIDGKKMDLERLRQIGKEGVLLLMGDSSNCDDPGRTPSERTVAAGLADVFARAKDRIFISAFSTSTYRLQLIVDAAQNTGRKVVVLGRSMAGTFELCRRLGYLKVPDNLMIEPKQAVSFAPHKLVVLCTGSQGEENSVLWRLANGMHPTFKLRPGDTAVFSARVIPGKQKLVGVLHDLLLRQGVRIFSAQTADIDDHGPLHISGHARREDVLELIRLLKPQFLMPIHGDYHHLVRHAELGRRSGLTDEQIILIQNGESLELDGEQAKIGKKVDIPVMSVYGGEVALTPETLFDERNELSREGVILISLVIRNGRLLSAPSVMTRGFVRVKDSSILLNEIRQVASRLSGPDNAAEMRDTLVDFIQVKTGRWPRVLMSVTEV